MAPPGQGCRRSRITIGAQEGTMRRLRNQAEAANSAAKAVVRFWGARQCARRRSCPLNLCLADGAGLVRAQPGGDALLVVPARAEGGGAMGCRGL